MILQNVSEDEIRRVLNEAHSDLVIKEVQAMPHGRCNWVFEVNGEWIFCFPRQEDESFESMTLILRYVQPRVSLQIPDIRFVGQQPRHIGYRKIGVRVMGSDLNAQQTDAIEILASFLCDLHAIDVDEALACGVAKRRSIVNQDRLLNELNRLCAGRPWLPFGISCLERVLDAQSAPTVDCLLHHDLHGDNVVVSEAGAVAGVIDFGDVCVGDIHCEFKAFCWHGFDCMEAVLAAYEARSGRKLNRRRIKDYFCVVNLEDVIHFSGNPHPAAIRMLARAEGWLSDWSALAQRGDW